MNTNAARTPSADPFTLVTISPMSDNRDLAGWAGTCQAITRSGNACEHQAVGRKAGRGPRVSTTVLLCSSHLNARYTFDADPSL